MLTELKAGDSQAAHQLSTRCLDKLAHWRYIRHVNGSEELYDHRTDPNEWTNLAGSKEHAAVKQQHAELAKQWK
jgi:hypothetical protein